MNRVIHALVPALVLVACTERPTQTSDDIDDPATSTSGETATEPATGTSSADPTDTGATTSTSTSDTGATTSTSAAETGAATTQGPPPADCPPCDRTWDHIGDLDIDPTSDLSQYHCMVEVHGSLKISGDLSGEQLAPLCSLRKVDNWFTVTQNALLTDLTPFANLEQALVLHLRELPALTAVVGLTSLREVSTMEISKTGAAALGSFGPDFTGIDMLRIYGNPALTDLSALTEWGLKGEYQLIEIENNAKVTDLTDLAGLVAAAGPGFHLAVSDLPGLTSLAGLDAASQGIFDLTALPQITDLKPLSAVTTLDMLRLRDLPLTTLEGLGSLQSAELSLADMPSLTSLAGLGPLAGGGIALIELPLLGSLQGLESLQSGDVTLIDLPLVDSLAPLSALTDGGRIVLHGLPLVTSLAGLDNVQSATSLMIGDCVNQGTSGMNGLTDLSGLGALSYTSELMIANCANLTLLDGAKKLTAVVDRLAIINNPMLPQAEFDAFITQVDAPAMTCFGDWGVCECIEINPP